MKYRPEIDGLRALAVLPVILFHAGLESFSGGFVGVDIFFVISGYLITSILINDMTNGTYSLLTFYERRARRILPALIFVILVTLPFAWAILLPPDLVDFGYSIVATMTFLSNVFFWQEIDYFNPTAEYMPLLHTWSLAVEEQFYILFPPLLLLTMRYAKDWLFTIFTGVIIASFALAQFGSVAEPSATFFLLPTRAWELLIGGLAAVYVFRNGLPKPSAQVGQVLSIVGVLLIIGSIVLIDEHVPFPGVYALPATVGTALIILFAQPGTVTYRLLAYKVCVGIGLISYSAYLWHQPLIALQRYRFPEFESGPILMGLLSLPLAWISWRFVEAPFRKRTLLSTRKACLNASVIALVAIAVVGVGLTRQAGWMGRFTDQEQAVFASFDDRAAYVRERFNALKGTPFAESGEKILLIGDSYGQDLINAIFEAELDDRYTFSTYHIPGHCGNLMVDDIASYQSKNVRAQCASVKGYADPALRERMLEADQIWLVSSWRDWTAAALEASVSNIASETDSEIVVFGRKHFGPRTLRDYHLNGLDSLLGPKDIPAHLAEVDETMRAEVPGFAKYIDVQSLLCADSRTCVNQDPQGDPLTFDGAHLTPEGARHLGQQLAPLL